MRKKRVKKAKKKPPKCYKEPVISYPKPEEVAKKNLERIKSYLQADEFQESVEHDYFSFVFYKADNISSEAFFIYTVFRADVFLSKSTASILYKKQDKAVSGVSPQHLSDKLRLPVLTIERFIRELIKKEWVRPLKHKNKTYYQVGIYEEGKFVGFESTAVTTRKGMSTVQSLKRLMQERNQNRHQNTQQLLQVNRRRTAQDILQKSENEHTQKSPRELVLHFRNRYKEHFYKFPEEKENSPKNFFSKAHVYFNRLIGFCGSQEKAKSLIDFVFDNYRMVKQTMKLKHEVYLSFFGTKNYVDRALDLMYNSSLSPAQRGQAPSGEDNCDDNLNDSEDSQYTGFNDFL